MNTRKFKDAMAQRFMSFLCISVLKTSRHYLEILLRHTDRLIKIVSELLLLSKLEEKGGKSELEDIVVLPVNPCELIMWSYAI